MPKIAPPETLQWGYPRVRASSQYPGGWPIHMDWSDLKTQDHLAIALHEVECIAPQLRDAHQEHGASARLLAVHDCGLYIQHYEKSMALTEGLLTQG